MLAAEGLLKSLSEEDGTKEYTDNNGDYDLKEILRFYVSKDGGNQDNMVRCPDGEFRALTSTD